MTRCIFILLLMFKCHFGFSCYAFEAFFTIGYDGKQEQEAHGPHCLPEKQFQAVNTFAQSYVLIKRKNKS